MKLSTITPLRMAGEVQASAEARKASQDEREWQLEGKIEQAKAEIEDELLEDPARLGELFADAHYTSQNEAPAMDALMALALSANEKSALDSLIGRRFRELVNEVMSPVIEKMAEDRVEK